MSQIATSSQFLNWTPPFLILWCILPIWQLDINNSPTGTIHKLPPLHLSFSTFIQTKILELTWPTKLYKKTLQKVKFASYQTFIKWNIYLLTWLTCFGHWFLQEVRRSFSFISALVSFLQKKKDVFVVKSKLKTKQKTKQKTKTKQNKKNKKPGVNTNRNVF